MLCNCFPPAVYFIHGSVYTREGDGTPLQYSCLENPRDRGAWWAAVHGVAKSWTRLSAFTFTFHFHFSLSCIGEGNGNPLQCSCLENSRDGGASWAAVYGVTQSWTRLKQFSSSSSSKLFQLQVYTMVLKVKETKNQFYENKITRLHFKIVNS